MMTTTKRQTGVSMLFALLALVVLSLGAVALVRSVDTGMLVLGNLGFKKDAVSAGSLGAEAAITWLQNNAGSTLLDADQPAQGYYATSPANMDPTGSRVNAAAASSLVVPDWGNNGCADYSSKSPVCRTTFLWPGSAPDNQVRYLIVRLCRSAGPIGAGNDCSVPMTTQAAAQAQHGQLGSAGWPAPGAVNGTAYRILTRTVGARGTVAYTETLVHF